MPVPLRRGFRSFLHRHARILAAIGALFFFETIHHARSYRVPRLAKPLDGAFYTGCQEPVKNDAPRANATIVMLARNSDLLGAVTAVTSLEQQWNRWFNYPIIFFNNEPWDQTFVDALTRVASGPVKFEVIPSEQWGFPPWINQEEAQRRWDLQEAAGILYAGQPGYRHMCRFYSGLFYDLPAMKEYKWFWRIEPNVRYTCAITYDPFVEMEKRGKKYGYTIALWERGETVPSLFRKVTDYKNAKGIRTTRMWTAMISGSWLPWPFRRVMSLIRNRDGKGDMWNMCHFWSNFEIADLDFFRSPEYREFFDFLDTEGGIYYERWGDAPIHSLAAALLLEPEQVHHFSDFGYVHPPFQICPFETSDGRSAELTGLTAAQRDARFKCIGCRCNCDLSIRVTGASCLNKIRNTVQ